MGEKILEPQHLRFYLEDEIVRLPNGEIYTRPGIALRGGTGGVGETTTGSGGNTDDLPAGATYIPAPDFVRLRIGNPSADLTALLTTALPETGTAASARGATDPLLLATLALTVSAQTATEAERIDGYIARSFEQLALGNYSGSDPTVLGTLLQVGTGVTGVDLPGDIRDLTFDFSHWQWSWSHAGGTGLDLIGMLPVFGVLKYGDEAAAVVKPVLKGAKKAIIGTVETTRAAVARITDVRSAIKEASDLANPAASKAGVKVLHGDTAVAQEWFEAMTKGWAELPKTKDDVLTRISPDGFTKVNIRTISKSPAKPPLTKIEATIDVIPDGPAREALQDALGGKKKLEIKFAM